MIHLIKLICALLLLFSLSACSTPALMFAGGAGTGVTATKQKSVGNTVDDATIWTKIKAGFVNHNKELPGVLTNISVEVSEGRVLLTGTANNADERLKILRIVWDQTGVHEVINEIKLSDEGKTGGVKQYATDAWITAQVKSKLFANKEIHSLNYTIETVNNVVYILGIASTKQELQELVTIAESVKNVDKVMQYVRVATDRKHNNIESDSKSEAKQPKSSYSSTSDEERKTEQVNSYDGDDEIIEIGHDTK